jgi:hypothetical protein
VVPSAVVAEPDSAPAAGQPEVSVIIPRLNEEPSVGAVVDDAHGARVVREPRRGYGRAYLAGLAHASGIGERDRLLERFDGIRLEHGVIAGGILVLGAFAGIVAVFAEWVGRGFGPLGRVYETALAVTILGLGVQSDRPTVMPGSRT